MCSSTNALEIVIHLLNGRAARFGQSDTTRAAELLGCIDPATVFQDRTLLLCGQDSLSVFPTDQIVRVEINRLLPKWTERPDSIRADQIADYDYRWLCDTLSAVQETIARTDCLANLIVAAEVELANAERFYLRLEAKGGDDVCSAQESLVAQLFESGGLLVRMRTGGYTIVNPAAVARFTICPALSRPAGVARSA